MSECDVKATTSNKSRQTYSKRLVALRKNNKKCKDERSEELKADKGLSEEEFVSLIDLQYPSSGSHSHSLVRKCNKCGFSASSLLALFSHMKAHMGTQTDQCGDKTPQPGRHKPKDKRETCTSKPRVCTICRASFTTTDQLFDHMNKHRDHLPFECPFCPHKLTNMDAYKKHVRLTHKIKSVSELRFMCRTCGIHFYTGDHLLLHRLNQNHDSEEPFVCKVCGASAFTANDFRGHIMEHSAKDREAANVVVCEYCYKAFFSSFRLQFHIDVKHDQVKKADHTKLEKTNDVIKKRRNRGPYLRYLRANEKYECQKCKRRFKTCDTLKNHTQFSHGVKKTMKTDNTCKLCGRKFSALRRLVNHMKVHAGTKPVFQCEECGHIYGKKVQVLEHIRLDHPQQQLQEQQHFSRPNQDEDCIEDLSEGSVGGLVGEGTPSSWTPIKSPFKVPAVEQTQEAVYSLLQLTDF